MSPRSIRRAAERKALKQARKASHLPEGSEPRTTVSGQVSPDEAALLSEPKIQ